MQQTLFGILALMLVGSITLTQNRSTASMYNELVDDELEIAASGVAMHVMELISNRTFDARTMPDEIQQKGLPANSTEFTSLSSFGSAGATCDLDEPFKDAVPCTDVDDAQMAPDEWQEVPFRLKDGKELPFDVHVDVFYVSPADLDTPLPYGQTSFHKKVIVKIRSKRHVRQSRYLDGFVRLERIFSYDRKKTENRYKDIYGPPAAPLTTAPPTTAPPPTTSPTDPNAPVWVCHRSLVNGVITWSTKSIRQEFLSKHIGHGDKAGTC